MRRIARHLETTSRLSLLALVIGLLGAADPSPLVMSYTELMASIRSGSLAGPSAIYCGSVQNRLVQMVLSKQIRQHGIPLAVLAAKEQVLNPFTGKLTDGENLYGLYNGSPGTLVFIDREGLPIPSATLAHLIHCNHARIIDAHFSFFGTGSVGVMTPEQYFHAVGVAKDIEDAKVRFFNGFLGRFLTPQIPTVVGRTAGGETWNPWEKPGVIHLITADVTGRAFVAQLSNAISVSAKLGAPLAVTMPPGSDLSPLLRGAPVAQVFAEREEILRLGPTPRLVITGGLPPKGAGRGVEIWGFVPVELLGKLLKKPVTADVLSDPDLPVGETDFGVLPAVESYLPITQSPGRIIGGE